MGDLGAKQLIELLAAKHAQDVFVPECKTGSTWGAHQRLDAWALRKSWSPWTTMGYEVKVSRSDFESDQKWVGYLPYCHEFSFVCPSGLIKAHDLPAGVGLIWCSPRAQRLHTKIKPQRRDVDHALLTQLMSYVLMSRARIVADMHEAAKPEPEPVDRLEEYRRLVEQAQERQELAWFIRGHVRARVMAAEDQLDEGRRLVEQADSFAARLANLGITWDPAANDWHRRHEVEREIDRLDSALGEWTRMRLRRGAEALLEALDKAAESGGAHG